VREGAAELRSAWADGTSAPTQTFAGRFAKWIVLLLGMIDWQVRSDAACSGARSARDLDPRLTRHLRAGLSLFRPWKGWGGEGISLPEG